MVTLTLVFYITFLHAHVLIHLLQSHKIMAVACGQAVATLLLMVLVMLILRHDAGVSADMAGHTIWEG